MAIDRVAKIMEILEIKRSVMVKDLSNMFDVTEETIRRDLEKLERDRKIVRVHGGAYLYEGFHREAPAALRREFMIEEKNKIGRKCLEYIEDKDIIILDNSTTSFYIAKNIKDLKLNLVIITNYLDIMEELSDCQNIKLVGIGGTFNHTTKTFNGPSTVDGISNYYGKKCFVSCSGLNEDLSFTDHNEDEGYIRSIMLKNAKTKFMVFDHTKLGTTASYKFGHIRSVDHLIVDKICDKDWREKIRNTGVNLVETG